MAQSHHMIDDSTWKNKDLMSVDVRISLILTSIIVNFRTTIQKIRKSWAFSRCFFFLWILVALSPRRSDRGQRRQRSSLQGIQSLKRIPVASTCRARSRRTWISEIRPWTTWPRRDRGAAWPWDHGDHGMVRHGAILKTAWVWYWLVHFFGGGLDYHSCSSWDDRNICDPNSGVAWDRGDFFMAQSLVQTMAEEISKSAFVILVRSKQRSRRFWEKCNLGSFLFTFLKICEFT